MGNVHKGGGAVPNIKKFYISKSGLLGDEGGGRVLDFHIFPKFK